jgi:ppGpp synthetase/RelA/SpoT-type nucleotidyltranferase
MLLPTSGEQIRKLGVRLATDNPISPEDDQLLEELVACHLRALELARPRLDGLSEAIGTGPLHITARAKTTGTIIEKLRRERGMSLARMRDVAGFRIVGVFSFAAQDRLYDEIAQRFPADPREPKRVDRRTDPRHGYRALHAEVTFDGVHIEIQIRTVLQHIWADLMERLADTLGRQIRYGEPPTPLPGTTQDQADAIIGLMYQFSDTWADREWLPGEGRDGGLDAVTMREVLRFPLGDVDLGL